jgi:hypothetical protein
VIKENLNFAVKSFCQNEYKLTKFKKTPNVKRKKERKELGGEVWTGKLFGACLSKKMKCSYNSNRQPNS